MNVISTDSQSHWFEEVNSIVFGTTTGFSLMLTGGRSAKKMYDHWHKEKLFSNYEVDFYFGDERCVPPENSESNYGMTMKSMFATGIPDGCRVHRIKAEQEDVESEIARYSSILPTSIDLLLLSVGEDGHIASIFPDSDVIQDEMSPIRHVYAPKSPHERFTITPKVLRAAKKIVVLVWGKDKGKVVARALKQPNDPHELPVALIMGMPQTTIILDKKASEQLQ